VGPWVVYGKGARATSKGYYDEQGLRHGVWANYGNRGDVRLLVDPASGLAHIQAGDAEPLVIRRNDSYWSGAIPLTRGTASLVAAARDDLGRLRVLDVSEWGYFAWILDEAGMFVGEEQFDAASLAELESLFGTDLG